MNHSHEYDRDTALNHAVSLALKGKIDPEDVPSVAKGLLGFLDPSTLAPPAFGARVEAPAVVVYWDTDVAFPYYRWYRGSIGYLHTPSHGVSVEQGSYTLEELQGEEEGYVRVPAGHVLPDAVKEAIA